MQTFLLFATIIIVVVMMVLAISKLKMHPFIVMLVISMLVGLFWGVVDPESGLTPVKVVNEVKNGFGSIMTSIGIVILCGTIIGTILGSLILVIIRQGLNLAMAGGVGISATNITYAVTGIIVVGAVMLDVLKKKNAAKVKIPVAEKKAEPSNKA